jgi:hypothetical protein
VTPDQEPAAAPARRRVEQDVLSLGDSGRQTVDGNLVPQRLLYDLASCGHAVARRWVEDNLLLPIRDSGEAIDSQ